MTSSISDRLRGTFTQLWDS